MKLIGFCRVRDGRRIASDGIRVRLAWVAWSAALCLVFAVDHAAAQCGGGAQDAPQVDKSALAKPVGGTPRWVCPEPNVTIEPIWRGAQIECPFVIRNEGKADLNIKAKGG